MTVTELYGILDKLIVEGYGPSEILDTDGEDIRNVEIKRFPADDESKEESFVYLV